MILLLLSLLAGILTVLAPCTISLLPVIVGGSVSGGQSIRRAITVTASLGVSVILFTLILKVSTAFINIPQSFWEILSGVIIAGLGLTMLFPSLYDRLPWVSTMNVESNKLLGVGYTKKNFWGDVIIGAALGPVFSSCSPTYFLILATVLPRSLGAGVIYLLAYAIGLSGTLLVVAFAGQKLLAKLGVASDPNGRIKKTIGVIFIIVGVAIAVGYDKKVESSLTNSGGFFDVTKIEQKLLSKELPTSGSAAAPEQVDISGASTSTPTSPAATLLDAQARLAYKALHYQKAPEITDPSGFINTGGQPITFSQFKGKKVILVDFWTYSCINCLRTIPFVEALNDKYSSEGLEVVSIHTPEFAFEHVLANVQKAVTSLGVKYPVVLDNNYGTWNAFGNEYWPQQYIIDTDGYVVYSHSGEGNDAATEAAIQKALAEQDQILGNGQTVSTGTVSPAGMTDISTADIESPETYFGYNRNSYLANGNVGTPGPETLALPPAGSIEPNKLYLGGSWNFMSEYAEASANAAIEYQYHADDIYFVAASENPNGTRVKVLLDGQPVPASMMGADMNADGTALIKDNRLYKLVTNPTSGTHTITITALDTGLDAYTFTFG